MVSVKDDRFRDGGRGRGGGGGSREKRPFWLRMSKELGGIARSLEVKKSQTSSTKRTDNSIHPANMSVTRVVEEDINEDDEDEDEDQDQDQDQDQEDERASMKVLSNGDLYSGDLANNEFPDGEGKYLWADGCMYVGEWKKGKIMGKGRFSWPSGATYEGEFKNGYMDGDGTYTGAEGTYKGNWVSNLKDGQGTKNYSNGDLYEGEWRTGLQHGQGRYHWKNGNHYTGQWKGGTMNGEGSMIWFNGNQYDGTWEDGLPKGKGTFRWEDGSYYVGVWSKESKEQQSGTYYPSSSSSTPSSSSHSNDWDPQTSIFTDDFTGCMVFQLDQVINVLPCQKVFDWHGRMIQVAESESPSTSRSTSRSIFSRTTTRATTRLRTRTRLQQPIRVKAAKKQGEAISKGHKNYDLMLNLQLGIRHSVGRSVPSTSLDLKPSAFDPKEKIWTRFPPEGSKHTPPHQSCDFRWKDYCPLVFRTMRKLFKVDAADYMLSICGNDALRELSSPGKSGSFFYLTNDDKYMIKTMKKAECKVFIRMLPAYYNHVRSFENTLFPKFFSLHCLKLTGTAQKKVRFVIMGNLFCTEYPIHRRFDLKGSSLGRTTDKPDSEIDATTTLKDLDLNYIFRLPKSWYQEFCKQVEKDCELLEQERIMDYSLLVGLHFREVMVESPCTSEAAASGFKSPTGRTSSTISRAETNQMFLESKSLGSSVVTLGFNMEARAEQTVTKSGCELQLIGEPTGEYYEVIMFFGIIDILQDYDISKKLEHAYKSFQHDPTSISAVDPKQYAKRFRDFMFRVFTVDES